MIDAPLVLVEPFAAQMAIPVSLLPYPPLLGIAFNLPASFVHDGGAPESLAEPLCRTTHRIDAPRVRRPRGGAQ